MSIHLIKYGGPGEFLVQEQPLYCAGRSESVTDYFQLRRARRRYRSIPELRARAVCGDGDWASFSCHSRRGMHLHTVICQDFTLILQGSYNAVMRRRKLGKGLLRMSRKGAELLIRRETPVEWWQRFLADAATWRVIEALGVASILCVQKTY